MELSNKQKLILSEIKIKGKYKPKNNDNEPSVKKLEKMNLIQWNHDFTGLVFTEYAKNQKSLNVEEY